MTYNKKVTQARKHLYYGFRKFLVIFMKRLVAKNIGALNISLILTTSEAAISAFNIELCLMQNCLIFTFFVAIYALFSGKIILAQTLPV